MPGSIPTSKDTARALELAINNKTLWKWFMWHHVIVTLYSSWLQCYWLIKDIAEDGKELGKDCGPFVFDSLDNELRDSREPFKFLDN